jgi:GTP pyrophosphokinase
MKSEYIRFLDDTNLSMLNGFVLAPYLKLAISLISINRSIGRNAFTHAIGTMAVAIDYKFNHPLILKGALCHDYIEDAPWAKEFHISHADSDGPEVLKIVKELTYIKDPNNSEKVNRKLKIDYLKKLKDARPETKIIKLCDRLDNLYTLLPGAIELKKINRIIDETELYILPIAEEVSQDFVREIKDSLKSRKEHIENYLKVRRESKYYDVFEYYHELSFNCNIFERTNKYENEISKFIDMALSLD